MSECRKCGQPLKFTQKPGRGGKLKWWPVNPDGTDHFDLCREITNRLNGYVNRDGTPNLEKMAKNHPPARTRQHPRYTHVWCGDIPPWDESLGEFSDFTAEEKAAGIICRPIKRKTGGFHATSP